MSLILIILSTIFHARGKVGNSGNIILRTREYDDLILVQVISNQSRRIDNVIDELVFFVCHPIRYSILYFGE